MKGGKGMQLDRNAADGSVARVTGNAAGGSVVREAGDKDGSSGRGEKGRAICECVVSMLRSRAVTLCFLGIGGILTAGILAVAGTDTALIAVLGAACLTTVLLWLVISGLLEWKRFAELEKLVEALTLTERYLLGEMLTKPVNDMEKRYFQVMKEISRSAIGIVEQVRREKEEYCDYVESWIHEMKTPLTACTLILDGALSRVDMLSCNGAISCDGMRSCDGMLLCDNVQSCDDMACCDDMSSCDDVPFRNSMSSCDIEREKPTDTEFMEGASEEKTDIRVWLYERQTDLRKLRRELKRADNLTESILYYARLRTAEKDVKIREFSVAGSVGEAVRSQMELLIGAGISVETEGDFTVCSDEKSLCFILKQLLINCAKYCPGCQIRIRAEESVISVRDNGPGIPAHELHRVTERGFTGSGRRKGAALGSGGIGRGADIPGFRNPGSSNSTGEIFHIAETENGATGLCGTGMGLYIVKELCDRLGITMEITSKEGEFTCVTLRYGSCVK